MVYSVMKKMFCQIHLIYNKKNIIKYKNIYQII